MAEREEPADVTVSDTPAADADDDDADQDWPLLTQLDGIVTTAGLPL